MTPSASYGCTNGSHNGSHSARERDEMSDTLQRELRLVGWILQAPGERHPIIERHLNHGAALQTPFLRTIYERIGEAKEEVSDESLIAEYGPKRFDSIGGVDRFRLAVLNADDLFRQPQAEHLAASMLEMHRRRVAVQLLETAAAEYRSDQRPLVEIEADLDRKLSEYRQYNPAADELVRLSVWLEDLPKIPRKPRQPILGGLWCRGEWAYLTGRSGKGKSWLGFTLADAIKGGRQFLGFETFGSEMRIGLITPELSQEEAETRFRKLAGGSLHPGIALFHSDNIPAGFDLRTEQSRRAVLRWIDDLGLGLLIVDPLTRCYHGQLWGEQFLPLLQFFLDLPRLTTTGCGLLLIHHESEIDKSSGGRTGRGLGDSRLDQRPRLAMNLSERQGRARLDITKANAWTGGPLPKFFLEIDPETGRWIAADALPDAAGAKGDRLQKLRDRVLANGGRITTSEAMSLCAVKERTAQNYLAEMGCSAIGRGPGAVWILDREAKGASTERSANEDLPF